MKAPALTALRARWTAMAPREQALSAAAAALVALALVWWTTLAPALKTLRTAPAAHASLDRQLHQMLALQAEAQQLQNAPRVAVNDAVAALRTSLTQRLPGTAQMQASGERVTVTLQAAPADGVAQWLALARTSARATVTEARLQRANDAPAPTGKGAAANAAPATPRWNGSVVLTLPPGR